MWKIFVQNIRAIDFTRFFGPDFCKSSRLLWVNFLYAIWTRFCFIFFDDFFKVERWAVEKGALGGNLINHQKMAKNFGGRHEEKNLVLFMFKSISSCTLKNPIFEIQIIFFCVWNKLPLLFMKKSLYIGQIPRYL